jgi:CPA2 family monovalent cation:H+ antiporter-2
MIVAAAGGIACGVTLLGLTTSLGAFIAGLVVSAGVDRKIATKVITPFQAVLVAIFFASVGMRLDIAFGLDNLLVILGVALAVVDVKIIGIGGSVRASGQHPAAETASAILLAQIGEFSDAGTGW